MDLEPEMAALQAVVLALIRTHPDRKLLHAELDSLLAGLQAEAATRAGAGPMPDDLRAAVGRWRSQIGGA